MHISAEWQLVHTLSVSNLAYTTPCLKLKDSALGRLEWPGPADSRGRRRHYTDMAEYESHSHPPHMSCFLDSRPDVS